MNQLPYDFINTSCIPFGSKILTFNLVPFWFGKWIGSDRRKWDEKWFGSRFEPEFWPNFLTDIQLELGKKAIWAMDHVSFKLTLYHQFMGLGGYFRIQIPVCHYNNRKMIKSQPTIQLFEVKTHVGNFWRYFVVFWRFIGPNIRQLSHLLRGLLIVRIIKSVRE